MVTYFHAPGHALNLRQFDISNTVLMALYKFYQLYKIQFSLQWSIHKLRGTEICDTGRELSMKLKSMAKLKNPEEK